MAEKRLIDANALQAHVITINDVNTGVHRIPVYLAESIINAPTVDAVEVVRCKDCQYWQDNNGGYPHEECRWGKGETPDETDFCSYGERKDNG